MLTISYSIIQNDFKILSYRIEKPTNILAIFTKRKVSIYKSDIENIEKYKSLIAKYNVIYMSRDIVPILDDKKIRIDLVDS